MVAGNLIYSNMAIQAGIGISDKPDPVAAGKDAVKQALDDVAKPDVFIVFSSVNYLQQQLISGVKERAGNVPVIGCSDAGEITSFGTTRGCVAVMAIASNTIQFTLGLGSKILDSSQRAGEALALDIKAKEKKTISSLIIFSDIITGNGNEILRGLQDELDEKVLIIGGTAGDDFLFRESYVYHNDKALPSQIVGLGLAGEYTIGVGVRHGWTPIGLPVTVTRSHGAIVEELDKKPAVIFYEEHFGMKAQDMVKDSFARLAITYPLGMKLAGSDEFLIRYPMDIRSDGAIRFTAGIPMGSEVRLMLGSKDEAIKASEYATQSAKMQLKDKPPKLALVFSSIAREKLLAQNANEEIKAIQAIIGKDVPLVGHYTYGEFAPALDNTKSNRSYFHNETVVIVLIAE